MLDAQAESRHFETTRLETTRRVRVGESFASPVTPPGSPAHAGNRGELSIQRIAYATQNHIFPAIRTAIHSAKPKWGQSALTGESGYT
jgi:hypothetical protein